MRVCAIQPPPEAALAPLTGRRENATMPKPTVLLASHIFESLTVGMLRRHFHAGLSRVAAGGVESIEYSCDG